MTNVFIDTIEYIQPLQSGPRVGHFLLEAPLTTGRGCAGRVDLPPQGPAELLSHPAAAVTPRRSYGVREGPRLAWFPSQQPPAALLLLLSAQGRRGFWYPC